MAQSREQREIVGKTTKLTVVNNMPAILSAIQQNLSRAAYASMTVLDAYQAAQIPVDTSALANNRAIENIVTGEFSVKCILRFNQSYAKYVNDMIGVNWKKSNAVDHWLSHAAYFNKEQIRKMFNDSIKGVI